MAHAYTTKRGKNKMSKLGVRKDNQTNKEKDLTTNLNVSHKFTEPKEELFGNIVGHLTDGSNNGLNINLNIEKCSNTFCLTRDTNITVKLFECSNCHLTKYCSKDCQIAQWKDHKALCKETKQKLKEAIVQSLDSLENNTNSKISVGNNKTIENID